MNPTWFVILLYVERDICLCPSGSISTFVQGVLCCRTYFLIKGSEIWYKSIPDTDIVNIIKSSTDMAMIDHKVMNSYVHYDSNYRTLLLIRMKRMEQVVCYTMYTFRFIDRKLRK